MNQALLRCILRTSRAWKNTRNMTTGSAQSAIKAAYYRGGTSRAIIFQDADLPFDQASRNNLFLQAIGSPDPHGRQLNGLGAGVSSLSKICIIKPRPGGDAKAHVDYTFVGMGIEGSEVDYMGNCGNMSAAIGPYSFNERLLERLKPGDYDKSGEIEVYIHNTNTGVIIRSRFVAEQGQARVDADTTIDGVSGLGTGVMLDFLRPGGSKTGKMLPTGKTIDVIDGVEASCVDSANPCVFVRAKDMGIEPTVLPSVLLEQKDNRAALESIREQAAVMMGICKPGDVAPRVIPKIAIVSPAMEQETLSGQIVHSSELDLVVRFISDAQPHRAIPLTGALCTATAAKIKGSIVEQCLGAKSAYEGVVTIGHPSGRIQVNAAMDENGEVESASVVRTARRLMDGHVYWNPPGT